MPANLPAVVLSCALALLAALGLAFPAPATAQTSAAPSRHQQPTGLLGPDDADEVARALDEAERELQTTVDVDVVVDETGRRVSTGWMLQVPESGREYATETPMPVLAEDVNSPDGIVVLVDPFEGTGSFVEAPNLSGRDERYLSGLMTAEFRRGSYGDGLIAVAHALEDGLAPHESRPPNPPHHEPATTGSVSGAAVALFTGGITAVVLLLGYFLNGERYRRRPWGPDRGVAFVTARHEAEGILSSLAPGVILLAEKEMRVIGRLRSLEGNTPDGSGRGRAEGLLRSAISGGFWESFVGITALIEEDPVEALEGLRGLCIQVENALAKLVEAEEILNGTRSGEELDDGGENTTRKDESDG